MPIPLTIQPGGIPNTSLGDNVPVTMLGGKAAEGIVAELHGKWYTAGYRGNSFFFTTGSAGTTIPVNVGSAVTTFSLWNPIGSGHNVELIDIDIQTVNATVVVNEIALWFQTGVGSSQAVPTSLTAGTVRPLLLGGGGQSVISCFTAATIVGTATKGPTVTGFSAVTSTANQSGHYEFDGKVILAPGTFATLLASTAAMTNATVNCIKWCEFPI